MSELFLPRRSQSFYSPRGGIVVPRRSVAGDMVPQTVNIPTTKSQYKTAPTTPRWKLDLEIRDNVQHLKLGRSISWQSLLRYGATLAVLGLGAYLGYDTWTVNNALRHREVSPVAAAVALAENSAPDETPVPKEAVAAYSVPNDNPRIISIPSIKLTSRVIAVGITPSAAIETPRNTQDTAWYNKSSKPGQSGVTFINAHFGGPTLPAVFHEISKLQPKQTIIVEKGDGSKLTYEVTTVDTKEVGVISMSSLLASDGGSNELVLMTCAGKYDYKTSTYDKRTVVHAVAK